MAETTAIEWTDATWSPWEGCTKVSLGCDHCYAEGMNRWLRKGENWGPGAPRRIYGSDHWDKPRRWNKAAQKAGKRMRVFPSVCDPFDNEVAPIIRTQFFELIEATPHLDWLLLTKRIGNADRMIREAVNSAFLDNWYLAGARNVWLGATVVNQEEADRDIPKLLATPARVRFLSIEPMLGPVSLDCWPVYGEDEKPLLHWVICGGESGHGARPMHPDWARSLRDQCAAAGVAYLFKQWGEWGEPDSIEATGLARGGWWELDRGDGGVPRHEWPGPMLNGVEIASQRPEVFRVGKKAAGRLLDGIEHNGFPEPL